MTLKPLPLSKHEDAREEEQGTGKEAYEPNGRYQPNYKRQAIRRFAAQHESAGRRRKVEHPLVRQTPGSEMDHGQWQKGREQQKIGGEQPQALQQPQIRQHLHVESAADHRHGDQCRNPRAEDPDETVLEKFQDAVMANETSENDKAADHEEHLNAIRERGPEERHAVANR